MPPRGIYLTPPAAITARMLKCVYVKQINSKMVIDDPLSNQDYVVSSTAGVSHQFIASYYATGTSGASVGLVNTAAAIIVDYK